MSRSEQRECSFSHLFLVSASSIRPLRQSHGGCKCSGPRRKRAFSLAFFSKICQMVSVSHRLQASKIRSAKRRRGVACAKGTEPLMGILAAL
jgi:hypothetical protein